MILASLMANIRVNKHWPTDEEVDLIVREGTPLDVADALCVTCATNPKLLKQHNKQRRQQR